jgi:hypothetical protein
MMLRNSDGRLIRESCWECCVISFQDVLLCVLAHLFFWDFESWHAQEALTADKIDAARLFSCNQYSHFACVLVLYHWYYIFSLSLSVWSQFLAPFLVFNPVFCWLSLVWLFFCIRWPSYCYLSDKVMARLPRFHVTEQTANNNQQSIFYFFRWEWR